MRVGYGILTIHLTAGPAGHLMKLIPLIVGSLTRIELWL